MAQNKFDRDNEYNTDASNRDGFQKEVGSLQSTAPGDGYLRENPEDFNHGGDGAVMNPALVEITFVATAVDDGVIENPESSWSQDQTSKPSNVHKITDALRRTRKNVSQQIHTLSDGVKSSASHVSQELKTKALHVGDEIKSGVTTAHGKVKANPYPYALGAVALGFIIGRVYLSKKATKQTYSEANIYQSGRPEHTGVHI